MANLPTINVVLEQAIHKTLRDSLQEIQDKHGVRVESVNADWIDVSTPGENKALVSRITLRTSTSS